MGYRKQNEYRQIDAETYAIKIRNSIHGEVEAIVDAADIEIVKKLYWNVVKQVNGKLYVRAHRPLWLQQKSCFVTLHRYLLNFPDSFIDHANGNPLDNRRSNIRLATRSENSINREFKNKTGMRGVTHTNKAFPKPYQARITVNGKRLSLGYYHTPEEAAEAYKRAASEHHGEFKRIASV